ncbi:MAG: glucose 1-dehydrogenase [Candidatus Nanohaloarchaea archaeon]|jgi:glucose 1-dehydrogenase
MDKVAVVTGAGQGIGEAIALRLAEEGYRVAVNDKYGEKADSTVKDIEDNRGEAVAVEADISRSEGREKILDETLEAFGRVDLLVNNAGVQTTTPFLELDEEEWDKVLDTNLKATYFLSQLVARHMVEENIEGDIVNISSIHEDTPRRNRNHYDASKAGIRMITKDIALELSDHNIRVNAVAPGFIKTPMNQDVLESEEEVELWERNIPAGRLAEPEEVAEVVSFLASDSSNYITGESITVDGALSLSTMENIF